MACERSWREANREPRAGQSTVEWIGLLALVSLLLAALLAAGVRAPGTGLAQAVASRIVCAASGAGSCGTGEPALIAAYGTEVGALARDLMPTLAFEQGSSALPVDWRRCRETGCADGGEEGVVERSGAGHPVTAFVHVVDCREDAVAETEAAGADCSGPRAGNLYIQYWTYYADSATLRGVPVAGDRGYHADDWESVQLRVGADGELRQRASSHHGYNHRPGIANWGSDAGIGPLRDLAETVGARADNGWGAPTGVLLVSGGSHAGNLGDDPGSRFTPAGRVRLVPLERIAAADSTVFAVSPPWLKRVWRDPEAEGTD